MVIFPTFSKGEQAQPRKVAVLYGCAFYPVRASAHMMGDIFQQPVGGDGNRDANVNAPEDPAPTAEMIKRDRPRHLLEHPGLLKPLVEAILGYTGLVIDNRGIVEPDVAVEPPIPVSKDVLAAGVIVVGAGLALSPVPHVVVTNDGKGTTDAGQNP